jgi:spoIIIJ-associated protein
MSRSTEMTGRTVAEATAKALRELGISTSEAEITVLARGRRGLFGILPGTPARVRVAHRQSNRDRAEALVRDIVRRMHMSCQLDVVERRHDIHIGIETAGTDSILVGKGGTTLQALEYLVNRMLQSENRKGQRVLLTVGGYRRPDDDEHEEPDGERTERPERSGRGRRNRGRRGRGRSHGERGEQPREQQPRQPEPVAAGAPSGGRSGGRGRRRSGRGRRRRGSGGTPRTEAGGGGQAQQGS